MGSALWVLGIVAAYAVFQVWFGWWQDRRVAREQERVAVAFMRLYSGVPPRRGR